MDTLLKAIKRAGSIAALSREINVTRQTIHGWMISGVSRLGHYQLQDYLAREEITDNREP